MAAARKQQPPSLQLLNWANTTRLSRAAFLPRPNVMTVSPAVGRHNVWERSAITLSVGVYAVADRSAKLDRIGKNARDHPRRNVHYVIAESSSVGESAHIASEEGKALLLRHWGWRNPGVETHQVGNRSAITLSAARTNRRLILH